MDTTDTDTTTETGVALSDFIYVTEASNGDDSCFAGESGILGQDIASSTWNPQDVDTSLVEVITLDAAVVDFESDDPVEEAFVDVFWSNTTQGEPNSTGVSEANGAVTIQVEACAPFTYRVYTDPALEETGVPLRQIL